MLTDNVLPLIFFLFVFYKLYCICPEVQGAVIVKSYFNLSINAKVLYKKKDGKVISVRP